MIIIADAGATSTSWRLIQTNGQIKQEKTSGFNLTHANIDEYLTEVKTKFSEYSATSSIFFYVAGYLNSTPGSIKLTDGLQAVFPMAEIKIASDLLAAARGTCGDKHGLVGILGTGSNLAYYDGKDITKRVPSLGYVLGDEGSGSYMGKQILSDFIRRKMPSDINSKFEQYYQLTEYQIIKNVYQNDQAKSFLGSFTYFIKENINHIYCYSLVYQAFKSYFNTFVISDPDPMQSLNFSGSVAHQFADILRKTGFELNIPIGLIVESPIAGLTLYHRPK